MIAEDAVQAASWSQRIEPLEQEDWPRSDLRLGFDTHARLLETVVLTFEGGDEMIIHAMPARGLERQVGHLSPRWYTLRMPTTRARHQVTETPDVARALDLAARRWPDEPRSRLLLRLVKAGGEALQGSVTEEARRRIAAVDATSGKYVEVFNDTYLDDLREDWPE